ncbi:MAG: YbaB/EbfC family nucleoid-associated protein [Symbiobacteriaceae bacterium]|nr:YbaB/EbfC family nucleoid-associated protein [Symbiobacteriaceae bacterium]
MNRSSRRAGGGSGGGDMQRMMREAQKMQQKMQEDMEKVTEELKTMTVQTSVGGGAVTVVATGERKIESITLDPSAVDPEDIEMLQDLVLAAVNEALRQAEELANREMEKVTGNLKMPF